jgi:hypothetical protein
VLPELNIVLQVISRLRERLTLAQAQSEAGYSTEAVVVIALLVAMAVAAVAVVSAKVLSKANGIDTGP